MRAITFQAPGEVRLDERPEPELLAPDDAIVRISATGVCGSDLHIYHGRVKIEPGFTIGHEYVGTVVAAGEGVHGVAVGDRVLGCFQTACGECFFCRRGEYQRCVESRTFGHGATLGSLPGTQADMALVPRANLVLRRVPETMSDDAALFAGDVMGTGFHGVVSSGMRPGDVVAVLGLGPVGLCAVQVAKALGAARVLAVDCVADRIAVAAGYGAEPVHLTEQDVRAVARGLTEGRGVDVCIEAVGDVRALETAIRITRPCGTIQCTGVYAERVEVHLGLMWLKSITLCGGQANVIGQLDRVLALMEAGVLDPSALVTHHMGLDDGVEAYALYDRREALKIVLKP
jgi:2-desacetyl-2-hydroxyethyl bacteriochlorophyllide A dehydrogenase